MSKEIFLIDGTSWLFRSYYAVNYRESPAGVPVNAVFGFLMIMQKFINNFQPKYGACIFDAGLKTFRNDISPEYKANRGLPPDDLKPQFDLCFQAAKLMGFSAFKKNNFEADDLIATICKKNSKLKITILSTDKDLYQLVNSNVKIYDMKNEVYFDTNAVKEKMGVEPKSMVDYQSLVGDSIDNIKGLPGIGAKTASALLNHCKLDMAMKNVSVLNGLKIRGLEKAKNTISNHKDLITLNRKLVTLRGDVPGEWGLSKLEFKGVQKKSIVFVKELGFERMLPVIEKLVVK